MVSTGSDRTLSLSLPEDNEVIKPQRWREEEDDGEHNLVTVRWGGERCSLFLILRQHDPVGRTVARIGSCHHVLLSLDYKYPQLSHGRSAPPHLASSWSRYCPSLSVLYCTVLLVSLCIVRYSTLSLIRSQLISQTVSLSLLVWLPVTFSSPLLPSLAPLNSLPSLLPVSSLPSLLGPLPRLLQAAVVSGGGAAGGGAAAGVGGTTAVTTLPAATTTTMTTAPVMATMAPGIAIGILKALLVGKLRLGHRNNVDSEFSQLSAQIIESIKKPPKKYHHDSYGYEKPSYGYGKPSYGYEKPSYGHHVIWGIEKFGADDVARGSLTSVTFHFPCFRLKFMYFSMNVI